VGVKCWECVILTVAWRPLTNTFIQESGGMSATAEVLVVVELEVICCHNFVCRSETWNWKWVTTITLI